MTGRKRLYGIQKEDDSTTSNQNKIPERVKEFYSSLYDNTANQIALNNVKGTDVPTVFPGEVRGAI